jgi:uncharacterized MAPEG superfamily protein
MTTPLGCLVVVALLPYVLSTLQGYLRVRQFGTLDNKNPRQQSAKLEGIGARCAAAQANAWEALGLFTAAVAVQHLAQADPGRAATLSMVFVATRILHPVLYMANLDALRSLIFLVGLGCVIGLFWISA